MKITKHGKNKEAWGLEEFKCGNCGCEFAVDTDEYYVDQGTYNYTYSPSITCLYQNYLTDTYVCSCPECHKIVTKGKSRTIEIPTITLTNQVNGAVELT